jgi:hypothetical protein
MEDLRLQEFLCDDSFASSDCIEFENLLVTEGGFDVRSSDFTPALIDQIFPPILQESVPFASSSVPNQALVEGSNFSQTPETPQMQSNPPATEDKLSKLMALKKSSLYKRRAEDAETIQTAIDSVIPQLH